MSIPAQDLVDLQQLANRYWALADLLEEVPLAELFAADATFDLGSLKLEGLPAIEKFFADRAVGMRETERTTRHVATNFLALPEGPDRVRIRSTGLVYAANGTLPLEAAAPSGIADFEDICLRQSNGRWLYHYRSGRTVFVGPNAASFAR
ncbi:MAG: nuclear transport factor 2 family protein [Candidatus Andeanibacterium colombiense]|uniref:Nuclear transport factor 2 family protein n=1 Tax=Candidatus Andeanibacterium colombiense TaxID=3121345 RepID=A0AAJ6BMS4_9SPHN|nr:MAG: nuclear transport factor 2 family protein [Sphingomonadaceae bacterium]